MLQVEFKKQGESVIVHDGALILRPEAIVVGHDVRIDSYARLEGGRGIDIGNYVHISSFSSIYAGGACVLGDFVGIAQGARLITGAGFPFESEFPVIFPLVDPYARKYDVIVVEDYGIVGSNAVVLPGVTIHAGGVLAAGAVATVDIPAFEIWAGVPARKIRNRTKPIERREP